MSTSTSNPGASAKKLGTDKDTLKVEDINSDLLKEILIELKINNQYLLILTDETVKEEDIEISK